MTQRDIILVPFPFTDLTAYKTRPALVISKSKGEDIIILAITSKKGGLSVKIDNNDLESGELPVVSAVRYDKVITIHRSLARKTVARLKSGVFKKIRKQFSGLF